MIRALLFGPRLYSVLVVRNEGRDYAFLLINERTKKRAGRKALATRVRGGRGTFAQHGYVINSVEPAR